MVSETSEEPQSPPPLPPRSPFGPVSPPHTKAEDEVCPTFFEEFPPYPPPPYPSSEEAKPGDHAPGSQLSQMTEQTPAATVSVQSPSTVLIFSVKIMNILISNGTGVADICTQA